MAKQRKEETDFSDVKVTLKPLFGIKPEQYLPVIYIVGIAAIVFFVLLFPGITRHGTKITFTTLPEKAPVFIDGIYAGSTPCTVFVKSGEREIRIKKPFYQEIVLQKKVKGGIFGTLFFPRRETLFQRCELADLKGLLGWAIKDTAQFAMLQDFTATYQFPPLITDTVSAFYGTDEDISEELYNFIHNIMMFVDSEQELWELLDGFSFLAAGKKGFTGSTMIEMLKKIIQLNEKYEGFPSWVSNSLSKVSRADSTSDDSGRLVSLYDQFVGSGWFNDYFSSYKERIKELHKNENISLDAGRPVTVRNQTFIYVPATEFVMGNTSTLDSSFYPDMEDLPRRVQVNPFYIGTTEVTNRDFYSFIQENPSWLPENRDELENQGLVNEYYLSHWDGNSPADEDMEKPVTSVSYFAAQAYCQWFSTGRRMLARLPHDSEWECVAKYIENQVTPTLFFTERGTAGILKDVGKNNNDLTPVKDIFGNVWEWCGNWFFPRDGALSVPNPLPDEERQLFSGAEKVVRGGCWANSKIDNIHSFTRGSQPPSWCTPYLGFRIVLSEQ
jgi:gamma-glutamyl hercynylcysteine S-oxide synthase